MTRLTDGYSVTPWRDSIPAEATILGWEQINFSTEEILRVYKTCNGFVFCVSISDEQFLAKLFDHLEKKVFLPRFTGWADACVHLNTYFRVRDNAKV